MRKAAISICALCLVLGLVCEAFSNSRTEDALGVAVSPQTLLLNTEQGGWVTVHTAIPYGQVDCATLLLNGVPVSWTKSDARGQLVAEFDESAVEAIVTPPEAVMTLNGHYTDGTAFSGSDIVRVIE